MNIKNAIILPVILLFGCVRLFAGTPGTLKWSNTNFYIGAAVTGSPAIAPDGSAIYVTAEDGYLYAIDPTTGLAAANRPPVYVSSVPEYASGGTELICSPAVAADGTVFVAGTGGILYSVSTNENRNWSLPVGGLFTGAVAIASNGIVYVTFDDDYEIHAVDPATTNILWSLDLTAAVGVIFVESPPSVGPDGTIYLYGFNNFLSYPNVELVAVVDEGCRGAVKWTSPLDFQEEESDFDWTIAVGDSKVYAPYGYHGVAVQSDSTADGIPGPTSFTPPTGKAIRSSPAIGNGTIYCGADDGVLYAVNTDGTLKWSFDTQTGVPIRSSPALASDGTIWFGDGQGRLWGIGDNVTNGSVRWAYPATNQPPLLGPINSSPLITGSDNAIYFGCGDGNVYAVYGSAPLTNSPWPMYAKDAQHTASKAPAVPPPQPTWWVSVQVGGPSEIWKGYNGIGFPQGGYTWFTITRFSCTAQPTSALQLQLFLGGDGTGFSSTNYNYKPYYAYSYLDFSPTNCHAAPAPNAFSATIPAGQTQVSIGVQTIDSADFPGDQTLPLTLLQGNGYKPSPDATRTNVTVHPDMNQF